MAAPEGKWDDGVENKSPQKRQRIGKSPFDARPILSSGSESAESPSNKDPFAQFFPIGSGFDDPSANFVISGPASVSNESEQ